MRRVALVCSLAFLLLAAGSAAATWAVRKHVRASGHGVVADLSFFERRSYDQGLTIVIRRHGILSLAASVSRFRCTGSLRCDPPFDTGFGNPLHIVDLDGDGEPEVLVELYTGGAHCCFATVFLRFDGRTYLGRMHVWGNVGYHVAYLRGNTVPELVSADDRFAYAFTSFAESAFPVQIWRYDHGALTDVTSTYRHAVVDDAHRLWHEYVEGRKYPTADVRGLLAAWLADEYRLGRGGEGWREVEAAYRRGDLSPPRADPLWPTGRRYLSALRGFLEHTGYASRR